MALSSSCVYVRIPLGPATDQTRTPLGPLVAASDSGIQVEKPKTIVAHPNMATAISIALYWASSGRVSTLVPPAGALTAILLIGIFFGAFANGSLFQAMGLAPNPGLPPVIYATASLAVFGLSAALATSFPLFFKPVEADPSRLVGMVLVIGGLYLLAGGRLPGFLRGA